MIYKACEAGLHEKRGVDGRNILHLASEKGNIRLVRYIIEIGCGMETMDFRGWTPLICAAYNGHHELVKYLISVGANLEASNLIGWTPLFYAVYKNHIKVVKQLMAADANRYVMDSHGNTLLTHAKGIVRDYLTIVGTY